MNNWAIELTKALAPGFFVCQVAVILGIFIFGLLITCACSIKANDGKTTDRLIKTLILSFPTGLSAFILIAYVMLLAGIPYSTANVSLIVVVIAAALIYFSGRSGAFDVLRTQEGKKCVMLGFGVAVIVALFASSGIMPLSLSNDSMYYFHEYPRDIVYFGTLRDQFDTFLTDTGLGSVVIETLPFLFGFNESFGIREFMHINFITYFVYRTYLLLLPIVSKRVETSAGDTAAKLFCNKANRVTLEASLIVGVILATSSPVWILGHWAMANMYFMEFFFMAAVEEFYCKSEGCDIRLVALLAVACSVIRIEGGIFMLLLVICFTLLEYSGKELALNVLAPMLIFTGGYALKIFTSYTIDNPYTFLTPQKAAIEAAAMVAVIVYVLLIKEHLPHIINKCMPIVILIGLAGVNAVLLLRNAELYIANLRSFYGNLMGQSGWGMMPQLTVAALFIVATLGIANRKTFGKSVNTNDNSDSTGIALWVYLTALTIGFLLVTVAVSYMRGDPLNVQVGDSGNRVLLQIAPLVIFTVVSLFVRVIDTDTNE